MKLSIIQNNASLLFYSLLLIQIILRVVFFFFHHYVYNGVGYTNVLFGYIWVFSLIPLSLILGFLVIKENRYSSWIKPLVSFIISLLIVVGVGLIKT